MRSKILPADSANDGMSAASSAQHGGTQLLAFEVAQLQALADGSDEDSYEQWASDLSALARDPLASSGASNIDVSEPESALWFALGQLGAQGNAPIVGEISDDDLIARVLSPSADKVVPLAASAVAASAAASRGKLWFWSGVTAAAAAVLVFAFGVSFGGGSLGSDASADGGHQMASRMVREQEEARVASARLARQRAAQAERATAVAPTVVETTAELLAVPEEVDTAVPEEIEAPEEATPVETPKRSHPAVVERTAGEWLSQAQAQRAAGKSSAARHSYLRLLRAYPSSDEARLAEVSLGRLELQSGKAKASLRRFSRYLAREPNGPLAEEARYHEISALAALKLEKRELEAIDVFLQKHPGSAMAGRLKRRAQELRSHNP